MNEGLQNNRGKVKFSLRIHLTMPIQPNDLVFLTGILMWCGQIFTFTYDVSRTTQVKANQIKHNKKKQNRNTIKKHLNTKVSSINGSSIKHVRTQEADNFK